MANRFIRLIEEGSLSTEGELKSAFRSIALRTHPDLGTRPESGAQGETASEAGRDDDFIKARAEYEAALRFLAPKPKGVDVPAAAARRGRYDRPLFYAELAALVKSGFPKKPRHDKERRKYARLRLHARSSLASRDDGEAAVAAFDAFEAALTERKEAGGPGEAAYVEAALGLVDDLIEYEECGVVALRAAIEIAYARLRAEPGDDRVAAFIGALVGEMDGGVRPMDRPRS
ncbi:MAG: hypothetical protein KKA67_07505 [Spirochaetes bacterium]|nr:hypothetical protein [Spirochaetota bacterium]